jgi:hypothetical protein
MTPWLDYEGRPNCFREFQVNCELTVFDKSIPMKTKLEDS